MGKKFVIAGAFCLAAALGSLAFGAVRLPLGSLWQALLAGPGDVAGAIFWYVRLPRTAACLLAGAALAVSGCILQSVLHNRLASPNIIGVNAGAGLAVTACCSLGALSGWAVTLSAFGGAMLSVLLVVGLAKKTGASRTTVILSGVALNSILNALRDALVTLAPDAGSLSADFRMGGFSAVSTVRLIPAAVLILGALAAVLCLCSELDVLTLGEETAQSLGLRVGRLRTVFLLLAALLAGAAVSFAGLLSFVGLLVPHIARRLTDGGSARWMGLSILLGAGFVTACDLAARVLFAPYELPVGILMAVLGGPFFLVLLLRGKGGHGHAGN